MKKEKEYEEHVKECLTFAQRTADANLGQERQEMRKELQLAIFDKCCSPHHYFVQNSEPGKPSAQPPSESQIAFARVLGIQDPEKMSKQQLSSEIDKARKKGKENQEVNKA